MLAPTDRSTPLDLEGLCARAEELTGPGVAQGPEVDARLAPRIDPRTVRYWQSLGLVDRPAAYEGRRAIFGYRHLLQVVAVRLLQRQGSSLAQIQQALTGRSTAVLEQAVSTTLGAPSPPVGALEVPPTPAPLWRTVELAPGVLVTLDLARVADPEALLNRLSQSITALHP
jgi:DNA-binding transcriptional MerR regulator